MYVYGFLSCKFLSKTGTFWGWQSLPYGSLVQRLKLWVFSRAPLGVETTAMPGNAKCMTMYSSDIYIMQNTSMTVTIECFAMCVCICLARDITYHFDLV